MVVHTEYHVSISVQFGSVQFGSVEFVPRVIQCLPHLLEEVSVSRNSHMIWILRFFATAPHFLSRMALVAFSFGVCVPNTSIVRWPPPHEHENQFHSVHTGI